MNKKLIKLNILFAVILQIFTIINGLIIPKLVLNYFGSEVNGLVSSITQFLNYIQLLEGGISGVAMAALYKSLSENNEEKVSKIIRALDSFFKKIALIYVGYAVAVAVIYPLFINADFNYIYILSLVVIIAFGIFIQYFFALTYRILIQADRHGYIVSIFHIIFLIINLCLSYISIKVYPSIHLLKIVNVIGYLIQPIGFSIYVKKHYKLIRNIEPDNDSLKQKWDGFGHNIAFFVHTNTSVVILTFFTSLEIVSVFSIYAAIVYAVRSLISTLLSSINPIFGNLLNTKNENEINSYFDDLELLTNFVTTAMFSTCIVLIVPFVAIYTSNITDINYIQPIFSIIFCLGEAVYVYRTPFVSAAYSAGHFKQTAKFAYLEAIINIVISLALVYWLGLIGVAIGLLVSMLYRMIVHVFYLKKNILHRPIKKALKSFLVFGVSGIVSVVLVKLIPFYDITSYLLWFVYALITFLSIIVIVSSFSLLFYKKDIKKIFRKYLIKKN